MTWQFIPGSEFAEHGTTWDTLQRACTDTPFLESRFIGPLLTSFGSGKEVLAMDQEAGDVTAMTLLTPTGRGNWQTFQPSQLPLGPWLSGPTALEGSARSLVAGLPGLALAVGLTQLDPRLHRRPIASENLTVLDYIDTSYIDVDGTFDEYWDRRGKNLRQNVKKQRNKLAVEGTATHLECITDPGAVVAAMADYGSLEGAGWKSGIGTAIEAGNPQGQFYTRMMQNFLEAGRGRIYRYRFGDQVAAMDLCIDNGTTVVVLKTAYDERIRGVSPSTLMRHEEFRAWWDEGRYRRIEFYGKTMEWHTRWTDLQRTLFHANFYRWPLLRRLHEQLMRLRASAPDDTAGARPAATRQLSGIT